MRLPHRPIAFEEIVDHLAQFERGPSGEPEITRRSLHRIGRAVAKADRKGLLISSDRERTVEEKKPRAEPQGNVWGDPATSEPAVS